ncbi:MAG: ribonuclease Z [Parcubacteria group bacterium Gr01-1014_18]|nr:MAG: ribonuclease Z [Parcubacteria group bacterium Greene0416_36]TSC80969.1 MAG: ribonuclease Z [Parcubacteria group bacterium Gr01-1014_18]TSC98856.1 MAG: ribonuclease Z [Parcubacteria group bacterium Greene1014_20]
MKIWGKSKAIHSTWFFLPTFKLLLDCGEGASTTLGIHASDVEYVFLSHMHLDHIAGLLTLGRFQKRTLKHEPKRRLAQVLYNPACQDKIDKLIRFFKDWDLFLKFVPLEEGKDYKIAKNIYLRPFRVNHTAPYYHEILPAIGCHIVEVRRRLRKEFLDKKEEMDRSVPAGASAQKAFTEFMLELKKNHSDDEIHETYERKILSYCGDSSPVSPEWVRGTEILMHESSFLNKDEMEAAHSAFADVVEVAKKAQAGALVVYHLSERYKRELPHYREMMEKMAKDAGLACPLYIVGIDEFFRKDMGLNPSPTLPLTREGVATSPLSKRD